MPQPEQLTQSGFQLSQYACNLWMASPAVGVPFERVLETEYWAHVAAQLRPMDKIEIYPEDMSYYALLLVTETGTAEARVVAIIKPIPLHVKETESLKKILSDDFDVKWVSPTLKYGVIRLSDKERIKAGFQDPEAAWLWTAGHVKTMGKAA